MLSVCLDNFIAHDDYFNLICAFLGQGLTLDNLPPTTSQNLTKHFMFVRFINPVFDELRDAFPEQADQIPDPLDLSTLPLFEILVMTFR